MADLKIRNDDSTKGKDNYSPSDPPKTLVLPVAALMTGIDPWLCGCRHFTKDALETIKKFPRAVLEHPDAEGKILRRVVKENGFSCNPYYVDSNNQKVRVTSPDGKEF